MATNSIRTNINRFSLDLGRMGKKIVSERYRTALPALGFLVWAFITANSLWAQPYTRQDTLRGSITAEREWWDLVYYDLRLNIFPDKKEISGWNDIYFIPLLANPPQMQIDLQPPIKIDSVVYNNLPLEFTNDGSAWFFSIDSLKLNTLNNIRIYYSGPPKIAKNAPWDGGIVWSQQKNGTPFISSAVQGTGASAFWPCKDHQYDEADTMKINVEVPVGLMDVSNGILVDSSQVKNGRQVFSWVVSNPINNYGVAINVSKYSDFGEVYPGEAGPLACSYYVLPENLNKAKKQFGQVALMLNAFEHWFGPYPFYEDGFKLVEAPYLGMEHQSCVAYGNGYENGYLGRDLSGTGWGLKFDFIIIHESGHEWFGNSITSADIADMWIHEGFTCYSEGLYLDYHYGKKAAEDYVIGQRRLIQNDKPIIGDYHVNNSGSSDMYYKGANMLHTLRNMLDNDDRWLQILRGINEKFRHSIVETADVEAFLAAETGFDLQSFFDQYLRTTQIPVFSYKIDGQKLHYRFTNTVEGFTIPLDVIIGEKTIRLQPTGHWQILPLTNIQAQSKIEIDRNFYVFTKQEK